MRLIHLTDLHVTDGPRLEDQRAALDAVVAAAASTRPDAWLLTGDLFGRTVPHRSTPAERGVLYPAVVAMAAVAPVVVIYGNHDFDPDLDSLALLHGDWPIHVVKIASRLDVPTPSGQVLHAFCLPFPTKRWLLASETFGVAEAQAQAEQRLGMLLERVWPAQARRARADGAPCVVLAHVQVRGCVTSGGEVLAGQEIEVSRAQLDAGGWDYVALGHLHKRQRVADRAWYPGSLWQTDHGEREAKHWTIVDLGALPDLPAGAKVDEMDMSTAGAYRVAGVPSPARRLVTLDWRWAPAVDDGEPAWLRRPDDAEVAACRDAEVRCRLVVPQQWVAACPWADDLARVEAVAHRVVVERTIEPTLRVRAPVVAEAVTVRGKLDGYWSTLASPPTDAERATAVDLLADLEAMDDAAIAERFEAEAP